MSAYAIKLRQNPIIPVLAIPNIDCAEQLALSLEKGGLKFIEVTLRTECAIEAIKLMKKTAPNLEVGVGTVLTPSDVEKSLDAGVDFIVTPGLSPKLRDALLDVKTPTMVGVSTTSEVMTRTEEGFEILKFFPAENYGGVGTLKSFGGPLKNVKFCPTGGITPEKIPSYLALPNVVACGGSWIATAEMMLAGEWDKIEANAKIAAGFKD